MNMELPHVIAIKYIPPYVNTIRPQETTKAKRLASGPDKLVKITPRRSFLKFLEFIATGFAQPT